MRVRLEEALNPAQKEEVSHWLTPHHSFSDHAFPSPAHERVTIPITFGAKGEHEEEVSKHLAKHGYEIHDYHAGLAIDKHKRVVKIGKALGKTEGGHLLEKFTNDPARKSAGSQNDYHVVISRHPHDVAGMTSGGHSWEKKSCMNFSTGSNRHYLPKDVLHGTHVAYYTHKDDTELERPLARIALKPFVEENGEHKILRPETRSYGNASSSFDRAVSAWATKHFPAKDDVIYRKHGEVYHDSGMYQTVSDKTANDIVTSDKEHPIKHDLLKHYPLSKDTMAKVMTGDDSNAITSVLANKLAPHTDDLLAGVARKHPHLLYDVAEHRALGDKTVAEIFHQTYNASERRRRVDYESVYKKLLSNSNFSASHMDDFLSREQGPTAMFPHPGVMASLVLGNQNLKDRHALEIVKRLQARKEKEPIIAVSPSLHLASAHIRSQSAQKALIPHVEDKHLATLADNWDLKGADLDRVIDRAEKSSGVSKAEIAGKLSKRLDDAILVPLAPEGKVSHDQRSRLIAMSKDQNGEINRDFVRSIDPGKLSSEHLTDVFKNGESKALSKLVELADFKGGNITNEHHDILRNHKDPEVLSAYIGNSSAPVTSADLQHIVESPKHRQHLPFLAMGIGNRIYNDQVYHNVSPDAYAGITKHLMTHEDGNVRLGYIYSDARSVTEHNLPDVVKNDDMSHNIFHRIMSKRHNLRENPDVMDYAVDHPNPALALTAMSYVGYHTRLNEHTIDKLIAKNNPSIDYNLSNIGRLSGKHVEKLGLQAIARSAQHGLSTSDVSHTKQTIRNVIGHSSLNADHLRSLGESIKKHLEPMTGDPELLSAESSGVGHLDSPGKLGAYHRLQGHMASLLYHVNVPHDTLTSLYPHADADNADRIGEHANVHYDLWREHVINSDRDVDSIWAKNYTQTQYKKRFKAERLNEAVSFGKTKVWILE